MSKKVERESLSKYGIDLVQDINGNTMPTASKAMNSNWSKETHAQPARTYTTRTGVTWPLRRIPAMIVRQLHADQSGKPEPPVVEVSYGKRTAKEKNENDPEYKKALEAWEIDNSFRIMVYVITQGVCVNPGKADIDRLREFFPGSSEAQLKYAWILESFDSDDEAGEMMVSILGQTVATEDGVRTAEATFPSEDQPD